MLNRTNIAYRYDGTYDGFLCCVFECFSAKEMPDVIESETAEQECLFRVKYIKTNPEYAERVKKSIPIKMSETAEYMIRTTFLSCMKNKELCILRFMILGYKVGAKVCQLTTNDDVHTLMVELKHVENEAHFHVEFLRFSEFGDYLAARISPKNNILPLLPAHFCDRFPSEKFIIYDWRHKSAFVYSDGEGNFMYDVDIEFPAAGEKEHYYRKLWTHFYKTIAVEIRINEKLRMNMMPKRYWVNMTEFLENPDALPQGIKPLEIAPPGLEEKV